MHIPHIFIICTLLSKIATCIVSRNFHGHWFILGLQFFGLSIFIFKLSLIYFAIYFQNLTQFETTCLKLVSTRKAWMQVYKWKVVPGSAHRKVSETRKEGSQCKACYKLGCYCGQQGLGSLWKLQRAHLRGARKLTFYAKILVNH